MPARVANTQYEWDVFVSHASEDKESVAIPLSELLARGGLRVWIDARECQIGDSLRQEIESTRMSSGARLEASHSQLSYYRLP